MSTGKANMLLPAMLVLILTLRTEVSAQSKSKTSKEIELLVKEKKSRTSIQKKIDSQLLQAIRESQGKKMSHGTRLEPADVHADNKGNVKVDISADVTSRLLSCIKKMGGIIIYPSKENHTIKAKIKLAIVEKIASLPDVKFISAALEPQLNRIVVP